MARQARGGLGVTRRLTPSGEMVTRRRARRAAIAAVIGMPRTMASTSGRVSDRSLVKNGSPVNGIVASSGRSAKNSAKPSAAPTGAATPDSTAAITEICRGVAPTSRIAAKRCSRRAADNRVAPPMKISTGNSSPAMTADKISVMPLPLMPRPLTQPSQLLGVVVLMRSTGLAWGSADRSATVRPTTISREFGAGRAASPTVPTWRPG